MKPADWIGRKPGIQGIQVRAARAYVRMTIAQLAEKARVSVLTVSLFERGRRTPRPSTMDKIVKALSESGVFMENCPCAWIWGRP